MEPIILATPMVPRSDLLWFHPGLVLCVFFVFFNPSVSVDDSTHPLTLWIDAKWALPNNLTLFLFCWRAGHPHSPLNKVTLTLITISTCVVAIVYATQDSCPLTVKVTLHVPEHFVADGEYDAWIGLGGQENHESTHPTRGIIGLRFPPPRVRFLSFFIDSG